MIWSLHYLDKRRVRIADASGKLISDVMVSEQGIDIVVEHNTGLCNTWAVWFPNGPKHAPHIQVRGVNRRLDHLATLAASEARAIVEAHNSEIERVSEGT